MTGSDLLSAQTCFPTSAAQREALPYGSQPGMLPDQAAFGAPINVIYNRITPIAVISLSRNLIVKCFSKGVQPRFGGPEGPTNKRCFRADFRTQNDRPCAAAPQVQIDG